MEKKVTLSIITINYNNLNGLARTVESVQSQDYRDFEWIVIDGGSTDGSKEYIIENSNWFSYWVSEPDNGVYNALNKGIIHAQGDWLLFLNGGDWLYESTTLQKVFSNQYSADILYGNVVSCGKEKKLYIYPSDLSLSYFINNNLCHQSAFFRRQLFENSLYDEQYKIAADYDKWFEFIFARKAFYHLDQIVCYYDTTGISSVPNELHAIEKRSIVAKYVPPYVRKDLDYVLFIKDKLDFFSRRALTRRLSQFIFFIAKVWDSTMKKLSIPYRTKLQK